MLLQPIQEDKTCFQQTRKIEFHFIRKISTTHNNHSAMMHHRLNINHNQININIIDITSPPTHQINHRRPEKNRASFTFRWFTIKLNKAIYIGVEQN